MCMKFQSLIWIVGIWFALKLYGLGKEQGEERKTAVNNSVET